MRHFEFVKSNISDFEKTYIRIPAAIRALDGYGLSVGSARNTVDFERKIYRQEVDIVDGALVALESPIETDISDLLAEFVPYIECEEGGTITAEQANTELPVPSEIVYAIKTGAENV